MLPSTRTPLGFLRLTSLAEGVSFLALVGVGMPLKYLAGQPLAVRVFGMGHGLLFILLCVLLAKAAGEGRLRGRTAALAFLAALVPLGPFFMDGRLKREDGVEGV